VIFPRVTEILRATGLAGDFSRIPVPVLEAARVRGVAVHEAIEALVYHYEGEPLAADEVPYVGAYERFVKDSGFDPIACEIEVIHAAWGYRGHPDLVGWLVSKRAILDVKTGDQTGAAYQLAAYRLAWNAEHPTEPVEVIAVLELRDHGDPPYRLHEIESAGAERVWLAAMIVFQAQQEAA
jgi:hypothetical protein